MQSTRAFPLSLGSTAIIIICLVVTTMDGFNLVVFGQALPLLLDDSSIELSSTGAGLLGAMVYLGSLPTTFLATIIAEKMGRHRILALSALMFTLGCILSAIAPNVVLLGLARFVSGLGVGGAVTTAMTLARNNAKPTRVGLVITITMAGIPMGGTLAAVMSIGLSGAGYSWRSFFWVGAVISAVILLVILATRAEEPTEVLESDLSSSARIYDLFRGRMLLPVSFIALLSAVNMLTWLGMNAWLAESMRSAGFPLQVALSFTMILSLAAIAGSFFFAWLADRYSATLITAIASCAALLGMLGLLLGSTAVPVAMLFVALVGVGGHSTQALLNAAASKAVAPQSRGSILAITNSMASIGSFFGPIVGGAAYGIATHSGVFTAFAITMGICVALAWAVVATLRQSATDEATGSAVATPRPTEAV